MSTHDSILAGQRLSHYIAPDGSKGARRRLRIYALDPALRLRDGQVAEIEIPFEPLPGLRGRRLVVVPLPDPQTNRLDGTANLDDISRAARGGYEPCAEQAFAEQMVYAVCSWTLERFRRALGREPDFAFDGPLQLMPNAIKEANAYYDRSDKALKFGHFRQELDAPGVTQRGQQIWTALSHDIIVHEMTHALIDGQRGGLLLPTNPDVLALHEGISDIVALFSHFTHKSIVNNVISRSGGMIDDTPLTSIGRQFAQGSSGKAWLRSGLLDPTLAESEQLPAAHYGNTQQPHARGALLLSAVFEAFRSIYLRKTEKWRNTTAGIPTLSSHPFLIEQLASTACKLAEQILSIVIRALDYLPPVDATFGEFLRAMITADKELVPDDRWHYREALIYAFRRHGITVDDTYELSERALLWRDPRDLAGQETLNCEGLAGLAYLPRTLDGRTEEKAREIVESRVKCVRQFILDNVSLLPGIGLAKPTPDEPIVIESVRAIDRIGPDGQLKADYGIELLQWRRNAQFGWFAGGATLVVGSDCRPRYVIFKSINSEARQARTQNYLDGAGLRYAHVFREKSAMDASAAAGNIVAQLHQRPCC